MMGGGSDLDEAFRWLCAKASDGDLLVRRARGDDEYNSYIAGLWPKTGAPSFSRSVQVGGAFHALCAAATRGIP